MNASHQNYLVMPGYPRQQCASLSTSSHTPRTHAQLDESSPYLSLPYPTSPYQSGLAMFSNAHRAPASNQDSSYPSPTTSVPSPGPHSNYQLDPYSHYGNGPALNNGASNNGPRKEFAQVEPSSGPTRGVRTRRQAIVQHGILARRGSAHSRGEKDIPSRYHSSMHQTHPGSRSHTPNGGGDSPELRIDLKTTSGSYHPITPTSLSSPYSPYEHHPTHSRSGSGSTSVDLRPVSPALSSGSTLTSISSGSAVNAYSYPPYTVASSSKDNKGANSREKVKKARLTNTDRKDICLYASNNPNKRQEDIANHFGVERSTISKILKLREQWLKVEEGAQPLSKNRPSKFPQIEEAMADWIKDCDEKDINMSDIMIKEKAREIAKRYGISDERFKASSGWVDNFKHRYNITRGIWSDGKRKHDHGDYSPGTAINPPHPMASAVHAPYNERINEMPHSGSSHSSHNDSRVAAEVDISMQDVQDGVQIWRHHGDDISPVHPSLHLPPPPDSVSEVHGSSSHSPSVQRATEPPIRLPSQQHLETSQQHFESPQQHFESSQPHFETSQPHLEAPQQHLGAPQQHLETTQPHEYHAQDIYANVDAPLYAPEPPIPDNSPMTIDEAEHAMTRLITFFEMNTDLGICEPGQLDTLIAVKCALFQCASGVPIVREGD